MTSLTLFNAEETLVAYLDSADTVEPQQEEQFLAELSTALQVAADKRDKVAHFIGYLNSQEEFAAQEIDRMAARKHRICSARKRLEGYVVGVIQSLGVDNKGKYRKLEGKVSTMSVRRCPQSIEIQDADKVPAEFKTVCVKLPAKLWDSLLDTADFELACQATALVKGAAEVSKTAVKAAIEKGEQVPGAQMKDGCLSLVVK